ncbi:hypothetical protein C3432_07840 [Citrobacter amalonaticus]|uniref:SAF domain-containing protein n=1 Tax=Citrobacter amalonaticus TaxID=35703 RepID=A0A2S4RY53_CITAM|nr:SAF domain-containing protein [Citrobacter amalonaticus]POT57845.1 hypothetical protein C3432_07840 [Citrobacter amalonaticus]POT76628.1 hypothetical protein C3436_03985 [Citrobacter amalonaticus]POU65707.1 hypothetical protein C3430_10400 [Citrobacter amalonaticus]POV05864.1 hypothetical protein C3424_11285 [Citrobacter amalonaticus]
MKRKLVIVYILMILVGIVGIFIFSKNEPDKDVQPLVQTKQDEPSIEIQSVVLMKDLARGTILTADDYRINTIKKKESEVTTAERKAIKGLENIVGWALKSDLSKDSMVTLNNVAKPGTNEYFELFLLPGNVVYTFTLQSNENYLLDNVKTGTGVDIYLIYGREVGRDMKENIVSPPTSVTGRSLKKVIANKRVLAINKAKQKEKDGIYTIAEGSQIIVELNNDDVKILRGLETGTKLALFPATDKDQHELTLDGLLQLPESNWVDDAPYLPEGNYPAPGLNDSPVKDGVTELRG